MTRSDAPTAARLRATLVRAQLLVALLVTVLLGVIGGGADALPGSSTSRALLASVPLAAREYAVAPMATRAPQARPQHEAAGLELDDLELDDESDDDDELDDEDDENDRATGEASFVVDGAGERSAAQAGPREDRVSRPRSRVLAGTRLTRGPPAG